MTAFPSSSAKLPDFEIPGQTRPFDLLEVHPSFTRVATPFAVAVASQLNDLLRAKVLEAEAKEQFQSMLESIRAAVEGLKAGYLLRLNLYATDDGTLFVPSGQLISAIGVGSEPLDALAEAYRVPAVRAPRPSGIRDVSSYFWVNRSRDRLVVAIVPEPLSRAFEQAAWTEALRRSTLGGTFVVDGAETLKLVRQSEYWAQVERDLLKNVDGIQARQKLESLRLQYRNIEIAFNDAYRSFQLAEKALASQEKNAAAFARIETVAALLRGGIDAVQSTSLSSATTPPLSKEKLDAWQETHKRMLALAHESAHRASRERAGGLRRLEMTLKAEWEAQRIPLPAVPTVNTDPF